MTFARSLHPLPLAAAPFYPFHFSARAVCRAAALVLCALLLPFQPINAQDSAPQRGRTVLGLSKSSANVRRAFTPIVAASRDSIVKIERDDATAALGTVVSTNGLVITKASEVKSGKLTAVTSSGEDLDVERLAVDDENDVALLRVNSSTLQPIAWASGTVAVGNWAITPGIEATPEAVGIVSVPPRRIPPQRALIGIQLDFNTTTARVAQVLSGLGAQKAGLKPGDIILAVNDAKIKTGNELIEHLSTFREGQTVQLRFIRADKEMTVAIPMMIPKPERSRVFDRQQRMNRLGGELSERSEGFDLALQHDSVLQPWQCGGPLLNSDGKAIGVNIARAGRVASYALPADLTKRLVERLKLDMARNTAQHTPNM